MCSELEPLRVDKNFKPCPQSGIIVPLLISDEYCHPYYIEIPSCFVLQKPEISIGRTDHLAHEYACRLTL